MLEVLVAISAVAGKRGSSSPNKARLASAFSTMASITRSAEPTSARREIDAQACRGCFGFARRPQTFAEQVARARQRGFNILLRTILQRHS